MTATLMISDKRSITFVASNRARRYGLPVAAKSANGLGRPNRYRRNSAPITIAGAFFVLAVLCYGSCVQDTFGCAGYLYLRSTNLCTAVTHSFGRERGSSNLGIGATPLHALIPSAIRAFAHRRMALSALRANSSLATRLNRYSHHMTIARSLESVGGAQ